MTGGGGLTIRRMVELGRVSRSSLYRYDPEPKPVPHYDMELRDAIQCIALQWPCYGRPRITEELRRQGWTVNLKRVYRLMREEQLAVGSQTQVRDHDRFQSQPQDLSEPGAPVDADRREPVVDRGFDLHPAAGRVRVSSSDSGCLLAAGDRLGAGSHARG